MNPLVEKLKSLSHLLHSGDEVQEHFSFSMLKEGFPRGALIELCGGLGAGKTEVLIRFLAENPALRVAWIESDFTVYPCALFENRISPEQVLFVRSDECAGKGMLWAAHQILRSGLFQVVVLSDVAGEEIPLRRLQLTTQRARASVFLLNSRTTKQNMWPIAVQLRVTRDSESSTQIQVLKYRGQKPWLQTGAMFASS